ncbi:hypothetical protein Bcav_3466 [Beutenbergia cavernae DSM 12333]|uniref:Asp23/Gls24 family envelope stress response protein n=1 Tax=Beutenbergia cavernae (strain ATCC BAA-8 / DSM 12333 / CCUG 43141 / JCM 11478 / NBRC 16432 / NCIMB 13614 / HKI 0122) TaxID=471853 RepID=C5C283_BEUC1|nr:Asp23/Gls24 family envelope stress response protein [Beutenbergia cavernae]ACQ81708.1 hypothetical protein Bcav_3466 [Beutenbergia cavernae DSM 12333]
MTPSDIPSPPAAPAVPAPIPPVPAGRGAPLAAALEEEPADRVLRLVRDVPGVVDISPGPFGEVATYLPGRRVPGVRLREDRVEVHLVLSMDTAVPEVVALVREALRTETSLRIDVHIDDVVPIPPVADAAGATTRGPATPADPAPTSTT